MVRDLAQLETQLGTASFGARFGSSDSVRALALSCVSLGSGLARGSARAGLVKSADSILTSQSKDIHGPLFLELKCYFDRYVLHGMPMSSNFLHPEWVRAASTAFTSTRLGTQIGLKRSSARLKADFSARDSIIRLGLVRGPAQFET